MSMIKNLLIISAFLSSPAILADKAIAQEVFNGPGVVLASMDMPTSQPDEQYSLFLQNYRNDNPELIETTDNKNICNEGYYEDETSGNCLRDLSY